MFKIDKTAALGLLATLIAFGAGLCALFVLRFEQGDIFPPYSSLRTDPLGAKALYQALDRVPGLAVGRHYRELGKLKTGGERTLFYLGLKPDFLTRPHRGVVDAMEAFAQGGARLVLAFRSGENKPVDKDTNKSCRAGKEEGAEGGEGAVFDGEGDQGGVKEPSSRGPPLKRWEVTPAYTSFNKGTTHIPIQASLTVQAERLPAAVSFHTGLCFQNFGPNWRTLYSTEGCPAIIERPLGEGSIVLVADSYLFSNEAMRDERHSGLLSWLIGKGSLVVFDEFHLGVKDQPGVMHLIRKYRLHGFLAALVLLAGLFVWQNAVPFVPCGRKGPELLRGAAEKDMLSGLIYLLRRNVAGKDILKTCFEEWKKSLIQYGTGQKEITQRVRTLIEGGQGRSHCAQEAVAVYREIAKILAERTWK